MLCVKNAMCYCQKWATASLLNVLVCSRTQTYFSMLQGLVYEVTLFTEEILWGWNIVHINLWLDKVFSRVILVNISMVLTTNKLCLLSNYYWHVLCFTWAILYKFRIVTWCIQNSYMMYLSSLFFRWGNLSLVRINKVVQIKLYVQGHKGFYLSPSIFNRTS